MENDELRKESLTAQMDYATKHFFFIADQRIKTFNFYVILLAACGGATLQLTPVYNKTTFVVVALFHWLIALVFSLIEQRNIRLLKICKGALIRLERENQWPPFSRLAAVDDHQRSALVSYRGAINIAFAAQVMIGALLLYCALFVTHHSPPFGPNDQNMAKSPQNIASPTPAVIKSVNVTPKP